jgi:hypothetical protein
MARLSLSKQQNHYPQGGVLYSLAISLRMVVPLLTATSRRRAPFTYCRVSGKACRSSSRPSLARRLVFGQVAASLTSFPLEELASASHDKSPSAEPECDLLTPTQARGLLTRARIRAPFDGKIIPLKTTKPLSSRWSSLFTSKQLEDGRTLADCNI